MAGLLRFSFFNTSGPKHEQDTDSSSSPVLLGPQASHGHDEWHPDSEIVTTKTQADYRPVERDSSSGANVHHQHTPRGGDKISRAAKEMELENARLRTRLLQIEHECKELKAMELSLRDELVIFRRRENDHKSKLHEMGELLETRRRELREARSFLASVDTIAESDIIREVQGLNAEVFQAVKLMTASSRTRREADFVGKTDAELQVERIVGVELKRLLLALPLRSDDPILLEIALQAAITSFTLHLISAWGYDARANDIFSYVHSRILENEPQSVAGRWRMLTRQYSPTRQIYEEQQQTHYIQHLFGVVSAVVAVAGGEPFTQEDAWRNLPIIIHRALKLRRMVGEDIIGSEYRLFAGQAGESFAPERMVDGYAPSRGGSKRKGLRVICPVEVGLQRWEKGGAGIITLVKPQVALQSLVDDLSLSDDARQR